MKQRSLVLVPVATFFMLVATKPICLAVSSHVTKPLSAIKHELPGNSDSWISAPMTRNPIFRGRVISASAATNIIVVTGSQAFTTNQLIPGVGQNDSFAVHVVTGTLKGAFLHVIANSASAVTVSPPDWEDLSQLQPGDRLEILPYWTPATLLPQTAGINSTLFFLRSTVAGVGSPPSIILTKSAAGWVDQSNAAADHFPIAFTEGFVFRPAGPATISYVNYGAIPKTSHRAEVGTYADGVDQEHWIAYRSALPQSIGSVGVGFNMGDTLDVFDNGRVGQAKIPDFAYHFDGLVWKLGEVAVFGASTQGPGTIPITSLSTTMGSTSATTMETLSGLMQGQSITGTALDAGTTIQSFTVLTGTTTLVLNKPALQTDTAGATVQVSASMTISVSQPIPAEVVAGMIIARYQNPGDALPVWSATIVNVDRQPGTSTIMVDAPADVTASNTTLFVLTGGIDASNTFELKPGLAYRFLKKGVTPFGALLWTSVPSYLQ